MIFFTSTSLKNFNFCAPFRLLPGKQDKLAGLENRRDVFPFDFLSYINANDFSYYIVSIQFIYLNVRSWFNLFGMIKGGTRDKQCAGGAGKVSCSGDGVQSKSRRKGVLFWCGM